jgi:hypothetical protein
MPPTIGSIKQSNTLPQLILCPLRDSTCLVKCLRGLVRAAVTAPNAPNVLFEQMNSLSEKELEQGM